MPRITTDRPGQTQPEQGHTPRTHTHTHTRTHTSRSTLLRAHTPARRERSPPPPHFVYLPLSLSLSLTHLSSILQDMTEWCRLDVDAYIVVYSVTNRKSFQKAHDLMERVRSAGARRDAAIIVVANKSDLKRARCVTEAGQ